MRGSAPLSYSRAISSSSILISSTTTDLPLPLCHYRTFHPRSIAVTPSATTAAATATPLPSCRQYHAFALPPPPLTLPPPPRLRQATTNVALLPPPRRRQAAAKLPPTLRCHTAATTAAAALLPPRCHHHAVRRHRALRCCQCR